ncbi:MAG: Sec-independent protein translocase protein TatB [Gammaproteobacteria bacterium]
MFDVGFWELVLVFFIALMVLGPERLPQAAARVGTWVGSARAVVRNLRAQIEDEIATTKDRKPPASAERDQGEPRKKPDEEAE